jgi:carbon monoxide dehydrogenase subunit G
MAEFRHAIEINATPDQVWAVLGDISSVDQWIPGATSVTVDGMSRVCTFEDGHTQDEQILDYSPQTRSYRYVIEGAPLPVTNNTGTFAVEEANGHARVVWESSFQPIDPATEQQLMEMWEPYLPMTLDNLKRLVEDTASESA